MKDTNPQLTVVGGGLAGCEAAWQAAQRGVRVRLLEMRPVATTGAHRTDRLAELVCSNSLGSRLPDRASGVLLAELRRMNSLLARCAEETAVPAGGALAVDRDGFAGRVTAAIAAHPGIELVRAEATGLPAGPAVIASGPLTSPALSQAIAALTGSDHLYFFDAIAPLVWRDSIDMAVAFRASRWDRGEQAEGDYLNCPLDRAEYEAFVAALLAAERIPLRGLDRPVEEGVRAGAGRFFEGCLPVEILARRGVEALAFGPMRPVGLRDPRTGRRPHAVLQLRQDDRAGDLVNMVGFQTNLREHEQERVFRMIPGLAGARFARFGQMHRNTFLNAPALLEPSLRFRGRADLFFAGQLTGVEGYLGNIATGLVAGVNAALALHGRPPRAWPAETMTGALCRYLATADPAEFQPMKANMGLLPPPPDPGLRGKHPRAVAMAAAAAAALEGFLAGVEDEDATLRTTQG